MSEIASSIAKPTPMMQQYLQVKESHNDCLLLFRMGDFYELFFEDAINAAPILEIALTRRGKSDSQDIPMCGVPHHSCNIYINKLVKAGFKVALCDQLETPQEAKERGGHKAVVKRDVTRIITPGTLTEDHLLDGKTSNYLMSICKKDDQYSIAYADISTLEFKCFLSSEVNLYNDIEKINPTEIIIPDSIILDQKIRDLSPEYRKKLVTFVDSYFNYKKNKAKIEANYAVKSLEIFGDFNELLVMACGSLIEYACTTQKSERINLNPPIIQNNLKYMILDATARKNLEIFNSINENGVSLLKIIDKTVSNAGGRLLKQYLAFPSIDPKEIENRQDKIQYFINNKNFAEDIRKQIKSCADLERAAARISYNRATPTDLYLIKNTLKTALEIAKLLSNDNLLKAYGENLTKSEEIFKLLDRCLIDYDMFLNQKDYISPKYNETLSELYNFRDNSKILIDELREEYRNKTGVPNLKIEFNNVIGYYIEVTKSNLNKITSDEFIHRQTMVNGARFITDKLKSVEEKIISAKSQIEQIEMQVFNEIAEQINKASQNIVVTSHAIAELDVFTSLAILAEQNNYCRPIIDNSKKFDIEDGRHPVVEISFSKNSDSQFIANNCKLENQQKLWLITGPNMAGKSTFLRQNAIIALLAHIGSFVPAKNAHIGIVDRIFSRVGAGDDLAQGRSTFLVEMIETATILNQATDRSLVILDEIGRGTSTYDGLAIAWSCLEYIHDNLRCRTLFATHYHELTDLSNKLNSLKCYTVTVKEWENKVIFMHKVAPGIADRSYGINVAELAGIPSVVINRAKSVLHELHDQDQKAPLKDNDQMLDLFTYHNNKQNESKIEKEIAQIDPNKISPMQALELIYKLKKHLDN